MSGCSGRIRCDIYRDKKYCSKLSEKQNDFGVCHCRHAVRICKVERCGFEEFCKMKDEPDIEEMIEGRRAR